LLSKYWPPSEIGLINAVSPYVIRANTIISCSSNDGFDTIKALDEHEKITDSLYPNL